jgi:hypothetical protein
MRRLLLVSIVAMLCASCGSAARSPGPSEPIPTATPASTPAPTASTAACPTDSPLDLGVYLAADPTCFGSSDVEIAGWENYPEGVVGTENGIEPRWLGTDLPDSAFLFQHLPPFNCGAESCNGSLAVYVDPASKLSFEWDGRWVVVTGHRGDPVAETCSYSTTGDSPPPASPPAVEVCRSHFVLTAVRDAQPPAAELAFCPTRSPLTVTDFVDADPACFLGRDVQLVGWADKPIATGVELPAIEPGWLAYWLPAPISTMWSEPPVGEDPECATDVCGWIFIHIVPGSGVTFATTPGWVLVTGHLNDPLAETCHWVYPPDMDIGNVEDNSARRQCRASLVLTSVQETSAPPS